MSATGCAGAPRRRPPARCGWGVYRREVLHAIVATWPADGTRADTDWRALRELLPAGVTNAVIVNRSRQVRAYQRAEGRLPGDLPDLEAPPAVAAQVLLAAADRQLATIGRDGPGRAVLRVQLPLVPHPVSRADWAWHTMPLNLPAHLADHAGLCAPTLRIAGHRVRHEHVCARIRHLNKTLAWSAARWAVDQAVALHAGVVYVEDLATLQVRGRRKGNARLSGQVRGQVVDAIVHLAAKAGIAVVTVPARGTSRYCPRCGQGRTELAHTPAPDRPAERGWKWAICGRCQLSADRDHAAAMRITARGLLAQHHVRTDRTTGRQCSRSAPGTACTSGSSTCAPTSRNWSATGSSGTGWSGARPAARSPAGRRSASPRPTRPRRPDRWSGWASCSPGPATSTRSRRCWPVANAVDLTIVAPTLSTATMRRCLAELPGRLVAGYRDLLAAVDSAVAAVALQAHG